MGDEYVVGVSAGACNATSYISRQRGRNKKVTLGYINDHRYLSYRNLLREKSMFGMDFIFNQLLQLLYDLCYEDPERSLMSFDERIGEESRKVTL
jgi:predicted patatin/cPLA2 family phospholipase